MASDSRVLRTTSSEETRRAAEALGRALRAGDTISLTGDLGAGKTTFTQGLAVGLGIPAGVVVNSPTFTILAEHPEGRFPLYHFDVYRLSGAGDLYDLAFDEYIDGSGVVVVEWADKIAEALPEDTLFISIDFPGDDAVDPGARPSTRLDTALREYADLGPDVRDIRFRASGPRSSELVDCVVRGGVEATP